MQARVTIAIVASLSCVHAVTGGIAVVDDNGQPVPGEHWTLTSSPEGYTFTMHGLHAPWQETWYVVSVDGGEHFREVRLEVDGPAAGSPVFMRLEGASSVESIVQTGNAETRLDHVQVTGSIGRIEVDAIGSVFAGQDVLGPIISRTGSNPTRGIEHLEAAGTIRGDILAEDGMIGTIAAHAIGTSSVPVSIRCRHGLDSISVSGDAYLQLELRTASGTATLGCLEAASVYGRLVVDGFSAASELHLEGTLHADLVIGGALEGVSPILHLPLGGLRSQVVINSDNLGADWTAPVRFGVDGNDMLVHGPVYDELPAVIGGGAIGLVPFRMHASACAPLSGHASTSNVVPVLRWYGPVSWPAGAPLVVQRRGSNTDPWEELPESFFYCAAVTGDPTAINLEPGTAGGGFEPGYEYRVMPSAHLRCDIPGLPPVSIADTWHVFIEGDPCPGDINGDAVVAVDDLLVLIACWGEVDDSLSETADLDGDGQVGVIDLLVLLGAWGDCTGG